MPQVSSIDFVNKRIYLTIDTTTAPFNAMDAYFEVGKLIADNVNVGQYYLPPLSAEGNLPKRTTPPLTFTPRFVFMASGWRWVPYQSVSHLLESEVEIISADGIVDASTFDRTLLDVGVEVDIDPIYEQVEIKQVSTGSAVTPSDINDIVSGVWAAILTGDHLTAPSSAGGIMELIRIITRNNATLDPITKILTVYEDDGVTVHETIDLSAGRNIVP